MISLCQRRRKSFDIIFQLPSLVQRRNDFAILQAIVLLIKISIMPKKSSRTNHLLRKADSQWNNKFVSKVLMLM